MARPKERAYKDNETLALLGEIDLHYPVKFRLKYFYREEGFWVSCQEFKPNGRFSSAISIKPEDIPAFIAALQGAQAAFESWKSKQGR